MPWPVSRNVRAALGAGGDRQQDPALERRDRAPRRPSSASRSVTGSSRSRSAPRRVYSRHAALTLTVTTTSRPSGPLPDSRMRLPVSTPARDLDLERLPSTSTRRWVAVERLLEGQLGGRLERGRRRGRPPWAAGRLAPAPRRARRGPCRRGCPRTPGRHRRCRRADPLGREVARRRPGCRGRAGRGAREEHPEEVGEARRRRRPRCGTRSGRCRPWPACPRRRRRRARANPANGPPGPNGSARPAAAGALELVPVGAEQVVLLALLGVGQDGVRLVDVLEPLLGGLVAGVPVGMVLARELAEGLLDVGLRAPAGTPRIS